ncbi:hypothetical protein HYH02_011504 [Chlamydomonas schloesseri]|uniref:Uncharacterized protein n=1 Tax=Chlamydomonas schloesseri TaxID=2026947 RepID=A0A835T0A9_9CHLO|nr:hypothetical protein HYH02_011504 [Chlamydomonas schloesseri]|eukprot:KAG2436567.1 hypothetical protein HYH02_011504 [Chlamydomonas schloesseri]
MSDLQGFSKQQFDEAYRRALERKRLFKEYLSRHQVMEKLNGAIEQLYECERLPENPMEWIADVITGKEAGGAAAGAAASGPGTGAGRPASGGAAKSKAIGSKLTGA